MYLVGAATAFAKLMQLRLSLPISPHSLDSTSAHHDGRSSKLPALLQGRQVRYNRRRLELQHVPLRASLIDLRMRKLQAEDMPAMCFESIGKLEKAPFSILSLSTCQCKTAIA